MYFKIIIYLFINVIVGTQTNQKIKISTKIVLFGNFKQQYLKCIK